MKTIIYTCFLLLLLISSVGYAQHNEHHTGKNGKEAIINTLESFHQAIIDIDAGKAESLLSDGVRILESGGIETKEENLSHHFHSDGEFMRTMQQNVENRTVTVEGSTAWVSTKTHIRGTFRDRELELNSLELAVLTKNNGTWQIEALHWSSANR